MNARARWSSRRQTLNPSTDEILAAISQVEAEQVIVPPNSGT